MFLKSISDIHLEFGKPFTLAPHPADGQTVLLMLGDLTKGSVFGDYVKTFVKETENRYHSYIFILGNHEYYMYDINAIHDNIRDLKKELAETYDNVFVSTHLDSTMIDGIKFIFGTMWTDGGKTLKDQRLLAPFMNDFRLIRDNSVPGGRFSVDQMRKEFFGFIDDLADVLAHTDDATIVVLCTHHMTDYQCVAPMYRDSNINGGFVVDLTDHVPSSLLSKIDVMTFGHTHQAFLDRITLTGTQHSVQIICNPRGYPVTHRSTGEKSFESIAFNPDLLFDLSTMKFVNGENNG